MKWFVLGFLLWLPIETGDSVSPCVATTTVPEFKAGIARTCGLGIKSVSIEGDHERVVYTITYLADLTGRPVAQTPMHAAAVDAARTSWGILFGIYPMHSFSYRVKDGAGHPVCLTEVLDDGSPGVTACVTTVGDELPAVHPKSPDGPGPSPEGIQS